MAAARLPVLLLWLEDGDPLSWISAFIWDLGKLFGKGSGGAKSRLKRNRRARPMDNRRDPSLPLFLFVNFVLVSIDRSRRLAFQIPQSWLTLLFTSIDPCCSNTSIEIETPDFDSSAWLLPASVYATPCSLARALDCLTDILSIFFSRSDSLPPFLLHFRLHTVPLGHEHSVELHKHLLQRALSLTDAPASRSRAKTVG